MKPGIWVAEYAHIHRTARVLAPCFIGASSKVRAAAVITLYCQLYVGEAALLTTVKLVVEPAVVQTVAAADCDDARN